MNTYKAVTFFVLLLIPFSGSSSPPHSYTVNTKLIKHSPSYDVTKHLPKLRYLCGGHVTGASYKGKAGAHIVWKAYSSKLSPKRLVSKYTKKLGLAPNHSNGKCSIWRNIPNKSGTILEICSSRSFGPWRRCSKSKINSSSKSVVMNSSLLR